MTPPFGGAGVASLYTFTAPTQASYEFSIEGADFDAVLSLYSLSCNDVSDEAQCALAPDTITQTLSEGETVHPVVDNAGDAVDGVGSLSIPVVE